MRQISSDVKDLMSRLNIGTYITIRNPEELTEYAVIKNEEEMRSIGLSSVLYGRRIIRSICLEDYVKLVMEAYGYYNWYKFFYKVLYSL